MKSRIVKTGLPRGVLYRQEIRGSVWNRVFEAKPKIDSVSMPVDNNNNCTMLVVDKIMNMNFRYVTLEERLSLDDFFALPDLSEVRLFHIRGVGWHRIDNGQLVVVDQG